jgi:hypothetical protein
MTRHIHSVTGIIFFVVLLCAGLLPAAGEQPTWEPKRTRVFVVSMVRFKGGKLAPWSGQERLDTPFIDLFKRRGVPEDQILFLTDEQATNESISREFNDFLDKSGRDEFLIFYFGSHGAYNAETGKFSYLSYDGRLPFDWAFDAIENRFKGSKVMMFADCCYSGGIVDLATKRRSAKAYACLSSTFCHNVGYSGWRFLDCLIRGFGGTPGVDLDDDGNIDLAELVLFSEKHMAFVAEGRPSFTTTNGFNPKLIISKVTAEKKSPPVGDYVEAFYKGQWLKSEITDAKAGSFRVHHTDQGSTYNEWVKSDQIRPYQFAHFKTGDHVEISGGPGDKQSPGSVLQSWESMVLCRFDGYSPAYDEWVGPSRIKALSPAVNSSKWSGNWQGRWENSVGESGDDSLALAEDSNGNLTGTWSGNVPVSGKKVDANTAHLGAHTSNRSYDIALTLNQGTMTLKYVAKRLDSQGSYKGTATFQLAK